MSFKRTLDFIIVMRIVKLLTTPFKETDAYRLGIIDENGKFLKKFKDLKTDEEKDAFSYLNKLIFIIKKMLYKGKNDSANKILTYTAIMAMIKESSLGNLKNKKASEYLAEEILKILSEDTPVNQTGSPISTDTPFPLDGKKKKKKRKIITRAPLDL